MITLNEDQEVARQKIINWYKTSSKQVFFLAGYAGVGKTMLISYVLNNDLKLGNRVKFCAPTGKAASVLLNKGCNASTIHKLIYIPTKDRFGKVKFSRVDSLDADLIVVDEFSMVSSEIFNDLKSFGVKILAVGDNGQLPPVDSETLEYLNHPDAQLSKIMRQEENCGILKVAEMVRLHKPLINVNYPDVMILNKADLSPGQLVEIFSNCDQVIAGKNETCRRFNQMMRRFYGRTSKSPVKGDKLICLQNNYDYYVTPKINLINGIIGTCEGYHIKDGEHIVGVLNFKAEFSDNQLNSLICDPYILMGEKTEYASYQEYWELSDGSIKPKMKNQVHYSGEVQLMNKFEYGYCITCHKSQGSEWDVVCIYDESGVFGTLKAKWLYTAITRAKKFCIIIR